MKGVTKRSVAKCLHLLSTRFESEWNWMAAAARALPAEIPGEADLRRAR
eukprot:CAMPEP_0178447466 /NCGR_PEP_ID=MMETSP0689_2-20121128/41417_1 /TAXON_ID=160604 /ORGANISM="Amphidinium massartii, Strain CS-259" /LENGTH=48 /DNA_ID= /DNA_START= /DNA_END= /DNA_ORIENTATION=